MFKDEVVDEDNKMADRSVMMNSSMSSGPLKRFKSIKESDCKQSDKVCLSDEV